MNSFSHMWRAKVADPVLRLLKQGVSRRQIAVAIALGLCFCVFPVGGIPTLLCLAAAAVWKLNLPLIQGVNYLAAPLQWMLFLPFMRVGEGLRGSEPLPLALEELKAIIAEKGAGAFAELGSAIAHAVLGWFALAPALTLLLLLLALPLLRKTERAD